MKYLLLLAVIVLPRIYAQTSFELHLEKSLASAKTFEAFMDKMNDPKVEILIYKDIMNLVNETKGQNNDFLKKIESYRETSREKLYGTVKKFISEQKNRAKYYESIRIINHSNVNKMHWKQIEAFEHAFRNENFSGDIYDSNFRIKYGMDHAKPQISHEILRKYKKFHNRVLKNSAKKNHMEVFRNVFHKEIGGQYPEDGYGFPYRETMFENFRICHKDIIQLHVFSLKLARGLRIIDIDPLAKKIGIKNINGKKKFYSIDDQIFLIPGFKEGNLFVTQPTQGDEIICYVGIDVINNNLFGIETMSNKDLKNLKSGKTLHVKMYKVYLEKVVVPEPPK